MRNPIYPYIYLIVITTNCLIEINIRFVFKFCPKSKQLLRFLSSLEGGCEEKLENTRLLDT